MDQRDLDGSPLEPGDLTGDDPSISETSRAGVEEANTSPETIVDTQEGKVSDESSKISCGSCLVLSINLIHCGNEFRNSVPVRTFGL